MLWTKKDLGWDQWFWKRRALPIAIPGLNANSFSGPQSVMNRIDRWGCRNRWLHVISDDLPPRFSYNSNHLLSRLRLEFKTRYPFSILYDCRDSSNVDFVATR